MNFLTQDQRERAIEMLARAPDEVLLDAMVEFRKIRHFEEGMKANVNDMLDALSGNNPTVVIVDEIGLPPSPVERENVSPGASSIGKIGSGTKEEILALLKSGTQPPKKYAEHLKLLWSRNEVQFDGSSYFL